MPRGDSSLPWLQIIRQWNDQVESAHDFVRLVRADQPPPTSARLHCTSAPLHLTSAAPRLRLGTASAPPRLHPSSASATASATAASWATLSDRRVSALALATVPTLAPLSAAGGARSAAADARARSKREAARTPHAP